MAKQKSTSWGTRIKATRLVRQWSQYQMANEIGVEQATVSRLENDEWEPSRPLKKVIERLESTSGGASI